MNRRKFLSIGAVAAITPIGARTASSPPARVIGVLDLDGYFRLGKHDRERLDAWLREYEQPGGYGIIKLHFHGAPEAWTEATVFDDVPVGNDWQARVTRVPITSPLPESIESVLAYVVGEAPA